MTLSPGPRKVLLLAVALLGTTGAIAAALDLYSATRTVRDLYSGGITDASVLADLAYATQESRRQFLFALGTSDPNRQLPFVDRARAADQDVHRILTQFNGLDLGPVAARGGRQFSQRWTAYLAIRDEAIAMILEGAPDNAISLVTGPGEAGYQAVSDEMRFIKQELDRRGREQARTLRWTFLRAGLELLALFALIILTVTRLVRSAAVLRRNHQLLVLARESDHARNRVLEMVGRNEPREAILDALLRNLEAQIPDARAIVSLLDAGQITLTAAPWLSGDPAEPGRSEPLPSAELQRLAGPGIVAVDFDSDAWFPHRNLALRHAFSHCCWTLIHSSTGEPIGIVALYRSSVARCQEPLRPEDQQNLSGAASLASVTLEHSSLYHQLAHQALHDPLTALPNRLLFQDRLQQSIARAQRDGKSAAVLWIDLDQFKAINDTLGHRAGDTVLRQIAQRITSCLRRSDTVARIGGDEFTVLIGGVEDPASVEQLAATLIAKLKVPIPLNDRPVTVTASIGISLFPEHGLDPSTLVKNADIAMYEAKRGGKNGYRLYDAAMGQFAREQMDIRLQLATALENGEFELHYQPQVTTDRGLTGFEALLRWNNLSLGHVSPAQFIPIAEETDQIIPIGTWVLGQACAQASRWSRSGYRSIHMAVNVSAVQLMHSEFVSTVAQTLASTGLEPKYLELELTETAVMRDVALAARQITALRALGVSVSIDDFGTGYSSLSYINSLPVSGVKIDQSFVRQLEEASGGSLSLIRSIVSMARGLDLNVVAEGVETEAQLQAVQSAGCFTVQGYHLHRPMTADHAELLLQTAELVPSSSRISSLNLPSPQQLTLSSP